MIIMYTQSTFHYLFRQNKNNKLILFCLINYNLHFMIICLFIVNLILCTSSLVNTRNSNCVVYNW